MDQNGIRIGADGIEIHRPPEGDTRVTVAAFTSRNIFAVSRAADGQRLGPIVRVHGQIVKESKDQGGVDQRPILVLDFFFPAEISKKKKLKLDRLTGI
jgi:hypothetical protein